MKLTRNQRTRQREADIIEAGGRKLSPTMLSPEATKALAKLRKRYPSDTAAICAALIHLASWTKS
jgi:hypothetical protein